MSAPEINPLEFRGQLHRQRALGMRMRKDLAQPSPEETPDELMAILEEADRNAAQPTTR